MLRWLMVLLIASPAFAYEEAVLVPDRLQLRVGHTASIDVGIEHRSGLDHTMYGFKFRTNNADVIALDGTLVYEHPRRSGRMYVRALAPGVAKIHSGGRTYAIVEVSCGFVEPVRQVEAVVTAKKGETVRLAVTSGNEAVRLLRWYEGRIGDLSRPLASNGMDVSFAPARPGSHYVWVMANSPCAASSAEFRIDVPGSRQRAVRH